MDRKWVKKNYWRPRTSDIVENFGIVAGDFLHTKIIFNKSTALSYGQILDNTHSRSIQRGARHFGRQLQKLRIRDLLT